MWIAIVDFNDIYSGINATLNIDISGLGTNGLASMGFVIELDDKVEVEIPLNDYGKVEYETGEALEYASSVQVTKGDNNTIVVTAVNESNYIMNGNIISIPLTIKTRNSEFTFRVRPAGGGEVFRDYANSEESKLAEAYLFNYGMKDAYVYVMEASRITTTVADTTTTTTITTTTTASKPDILYGDANEDGQVDIADATAIIQHMGNPDEYALSVKGAVNADIVNTGDGVTGADAVALQLIEAKKIKSSELPITMEQYNALLME